MSTLKIRKAIFPGSFDPFTLGHKSIVDRALQIFDEIIINIGYNEKKTGFMPIEKRKEYISSIYHDNPRVSVTTYAGLTMELANGLGINTLIRGVRSVTDFEFERNMADANNALGGLETIFLISYPQYSFISSSMVRELMGFGHNADKFLPLPLNL